MPKGAAIVACASTIPNAVPWRGIYTSVRAKYGYSMGARGFNESDYFSASAFKFSNFVIVKSDTVFTLDLLLQNALSYRSTSALSKSDIAALRSDLADVLQPYRDQTGAIKGAIQSAGGIFLKA